MKNVGKVFEEEIKSSVPERHFYYRLRDNATAWSGGTSNTRFTTNNICDAFVMTDNYLFLLELKNTMQASLSINNIKPNQLQGLSSVEHSKIKPYFIVCFRAKERAFAVNAKDLKEYIDTTDRKSVPLNWFEEYGVEIPMTKKRVRYSYDLSVLFDK